MKILLLSDFNSIHTIKWAKSLADNGIEILLVGFSKANTEAYKDFQNISIYGFNITDGTISSSTNFNKLKYVRLLPKLKKLIKTFKPDILHAHYASSYGFLGMLSGFHPFILSVWGSDVFEFPKKSILHKTILAKNLKKADVILSTSKIMALEAQQYTTQNIDITPFGIDTSLFQPKQTPSLFDKNDIIIGTIKSLESVYGIDTLIETFKLLINKFQTTPLKLLIVGDGTKKKDFQQMVSNLDLKDRTIFVGKVPHNEIPRYHNMIDIPVFLSNSESFGVAVIEASACEKPVVVSNVGGLPEVVEHEKTGLIVPPDNPEAAAKAIEKLILDETLRSKMGQAGREKVIRQYDWKKNIEQMITIYHKTINK